MMRFLSLLLLGLCPCVVSVVMWSVCEVVVVPYVDAEVAVTVIRVLLFVLHVCMLKECDGARLTAMLVWGMDVVVVSAGHVGGTRGSGIMFSAVDVLWMSVMRGVGVVCEMCMCFALGRERGEWMRGLGLGVTNPVGAGGVLDVCMCFGCGGVDGVGDLNQGLEGWCYVCVSCEYGLYVYCAWRIRDCA